MTASGTVRRLGQVVKLRSEHRDDYLQLHADVWPGVEQALRRAGFRNYTIFVHEDLLFGYVEYTGDDLDADLASIAADPLTREWWALTDPCQRPLGNAPGGGPWADMAEIWHLE